MAWTCWARFPQSIQSHPQPPINGLAAHRATPAKSCCCRLKFHAITMSHVAAGMRANRIFQLTRTPRCAVLYDVVHDKSTVVRLAFRISVGSGKTPRPIL